MVDSLNIKIKYHEGAHKLESHGNWIDLACCGDVELHAGEFKIIPFNISMKIPFGYEGILAPRSSTFKKWKILQTNGFGVIDTGFAGEDDRWGMPVYATEDVVIPDGTRIAQFRIQKTMPPVEFEEVDYMGVDNRGGFGASGSEAAE